MGGMGGMGGGSGCKISMLWNWYTIDACFISRTWRITSRGMFAGSCIGVICLVCSLEFLRRLGKEYDRYLVRQFERRSYQGAPSELSDERLTNERSYQGAQSEGSDERLTDGRSSGGAKVFSVAAMRRLRRQGTFKPNVVQQFTRALLHMMQFGVAYFIMLLAMYYNGYIIICILIGALVGSFLFNWESLGGVARQSDAEDPTVCCG